MPVEVFEAPRSANQGLTRAGVSQIAEVAWAAGRFAKIWAGGASRGVRAPNSLTRLAGVAEAVFANLGFRGIGRRVCEAGHDRQVLERSGDGRRAGLENGDFGAGVSRGLRKARRHEPAPWPKGWQRIGLAARGRHLAPTWRQPEVLGSEIV
jgi:hypothetical protein